MAGETRRTVGAVMGTFGALLAFAGLVMAGYGGAVVWRATENTFLDAQRNDVVEMGGAIAAVGGAVFALGAILAAAGVGAYVSGRARQRRVDETSA